MGIAFSIEGLCVYITEKISAEAIESYQGQGFLEDAPLIQQDPLEDFKKFGNNDTIFQEYDPPPGDDTKMGWKRSRPPKWWMSLWKAMKCVFCIQILGGLALGFFVSLILVLDFNSIDLCYETFHANQPSEIVGKFIHWNSTSHEIQAIIVTGDTTEAYLVLMLPCLLVISMFGWPLVRKLNLLILNLLAAFFDTCYRLYLRVYGIYNKS